MVTSTTNVINTSTNEAINENKFENDRIVIKVSPSIPLGRVGNDGCLKGCFCSEIVFNLSNKILSDL